MKIYFTLLFGLLFYPQFGQENVIRQLDEKAFLYNAIAQEIWHFAELGYREEKSSTKLQNTLEK